MAHTKEYYEKNRDHILAKRRERYQNDPDYRKRALERARKYREQKRAEKGSFDNAVLIDGVKVPAVSAAEVEKQLGLSDGKLKAYQKEGRIPKAFVSHPVRLYTQNQITLIKELSDFLAENRSALRRPATDAGVKAREQLDQLVTTIKQNWKA